MVKYNNNEEGTAVSTLKFRMSDIPKEELYEGDNLFYRFLKARDFNIDNAEKMLREHLEWRKQRDVKNYSKYKLPEVLEKYMPFNVIGRDKEGCVVRYIPSGNLDWKGIFASCTYEDFEKRFIQLFEEDVKDLKIKSENEKTSENEGKFIYIFDLVNFSLAQATHKKSMSYFIGLTNMFLKNYPETLKFVYNINVSMYYHMTFSILQKFIPDTVQNKFIIYSDDSYKDVFQEIIDPKILPAFLGGELTDPDGNPLCNTFINHGEPVPETYYIQRNRKPLSILPDVEQMTLPRADFKEVFVEVKEPESYLEWEFETVSRDIGFGLFFEDEEGDMTEIIPIVRIDTDDHTETGLYKCEKTGKYIVIFDNTYSIFRRKDIYYRIKVKKGQEEESEIVK